MPEQPKQPLSPNDSKNGAKPRKPKRETKASLKHKLKLELLRSCMIYGKTYDETKAYFKLKGFEIGETVFTEMRAELKSRNSAEGWFSNEALFVIEEDHQLSVERIRMIENRLLGEFEQLAATNYYTYINQGKEDQALIRNEVHDLSGLLRVSAEFRALQETKTKMFSATPLVQEIMEVHARQEEEDATPKKPVKGTKAVVPKVTVK
jgi:hypothetical protein